MCTYQIHQALKSSLVLGFGETVTFDFFWFLRQWIMFQNHKSADMMHYVYIFTRLSHTLSGQWGVVDIRCGEMSACIKPAPRILQCNSGTLADPVGPVWGCGGRHDATAHSCFCSYFLFSLSPSLLPFSSHWWQVRGRRSVAFISPAERTKPLFGNLLLCSNIQWLGNSCRVLIVSFGLTRAYWQHRSRLKVLSLSVILIPLSHFLWLV